MAVRRSVTVGAIAAASLVALAVIALGALWFVQRDRVLPNTVVAGVEVGRLTAAEVRAALSPLAEQRETEPVELAFDGEVFALEPAEVAYRVDLDATVQSALARGRGGLPGDVTARLVAFRRAAEFDLVQAYDHDAVTSWVDGVAAEVDRVLSPGRVEADPVTLEVIVDLPHGSAEVRRDETVDLIVTALRGAGPRQFDLPADTESQRVPDADVEEVATQVERAIAQPLVLHGPQDTSLVLERQELARLITVAERPAGDGATVELVVEAATVASLLGGRVDRFATDPVDASFELSRTPPVRFDAQSTTSFAPVEAPAEIVPGRPGTRFSPELAAVQLTELLRLGAREAELRLETVEPEVSTEQAEALAPTHLLGTFTTYHPAGQARVVNIQMLADEIDGAVVLPGEQFSINGISGRRTCERGYRPAGTIIRGELVDTCGGGTSQFGTTTFNAAFFAGVQLDQWKAHSWYFTRYPMGREATLNYPELDVKFTNTTDGAVIVKTSYTGSSITVSVYGKPLATVVRAEHGSPFNHRSYSTQRESSSDRCEGDERVIQAGAGGFTVDVQRIVERNNGSNDTQTIRTVYVPRPQIVEVGTKDCDDDDDEDDD